MREIVDKLDTADVINRSMQIPDRTMADWIKVVEFHEDEAHVNSDLVKALHRERCMRGSWFELVLECLFRNFDGRTLPGKLFGVTENVKLPKFEKVRKEYFSIGGMGSHYAQIDVCGWVGKTVWLGESKLWKRRVSESEVKKIYGVKKFVEYDYEVQIFYFAASGVTKPAEKLLKDNAYIVDLKSMNNY
jgi:hypothetical protein